MSSLLRSAYLAATVAAACFISHTPVSATSPDAVAYRTNPAHSGQATMPDFPASPAVKWDVPLQGKISYPLIAGGQVFVVTNGDRPRLYALNATDGSIHWGPVNLPSGEQAICYDNGKVFIAMGQLNDNEGGMILAYDAATGGLDWSANYAGQWWSGDGPTALNGYVYAQEAGNVSAIRETDGNVIWTTPQLETEDGDLAVTASGLYISGACGDTFSLNPASGATLWSLQTGCEGGGGYTTAYYNGGVFIQDYYTGSFPDLSAAVTASTGTLAHTFSNEGPPAFDNGLMFGVSGNAVIATNLTTWNNAWTGNNGIDLPVTAPTVVNGIVYVGTSTGYLKGYDENTGSVTTMLNLGETPSATSDPYVDMAAGDGMLIVPAGNRLVAVGGASATTLPTPPTGLQATPGDTQVKLSWTASPGAASYNVYKSTATGGEGVVPAATGLTSNSFTMTGLTDGITYYFEVSAVSGGVEGGKSNEASAMPMPPVTAASSDAVAYRSNPAHTGQATMLGFGASPAVSWNINLPGNVSYPLIAGGRVFVLVSLSSSQHTLYALNAATGAVIWGPIALPNGTYTFSGAALAYDNGKVYITENQPAIEDGLIVAYDAATGVVDWSSTYPGQWWSGDGPTALNGYIYAQEAGNVSRIRETDGTVMWTTACETLYGDLAVTATALYITGACGQTYSLDPLTGVALWHLSTGCEGGGGDTAAYYSGKVYINDYYLSNGPTNQAAAVDSATGLVTSVFAPEGPLAFDNGLMFGVANKQIIATNVSNGIAAWTTPTGTDAPVTAPTVVNGTVYFGTAGGYLKGYDENSGALATTLNLGETPSAASDALVDMSAGDDMIIVPAGTHLVAVTATAAPAPPAPPVGLIATSGNAQVTLSWSSDIDATSYNVKRSTVSGSGYTQVANIVPASYTNTGLSNGTTYYFVVSALNTGGESANSSQVSAVPHAPVSVPYDFNGDGKVDLVLQNAATNVIGVWYMNAATVLSAQNVSLTPASGWKAVGEGDFNGDGKPDLVLQNTALNKAAIWYMNGATFVSGQYVTVGTPAGWSVVAVGDFNGDGKPDIVLQNAATNKVAIWYMNGATVTSGAYVSLTAAGWRVAGAGDFNGDGKTDLILQSTVNNKIAVWHMNGTTVVSGQYLTSWPAAGWSVAGAGDFNSDGKPDLVLQNTTSNKVALWYMNGVNVLGGEYTSMTPVAGWHVAGPR